MQEKRLSRRSLLRGRLKPSEAVRLPWTLGEDHFTDHCSRCDACIKACPEKIITKGDGGFPALDFRQGECTFCQDCVDACPEPLFSDPKTTSPWGYKAIIQDNCLTHKGVHCQSCQDNCEPWAIRFPPRLGGVAQPQVDFDDCTGCGACITACPADAIKLQLPPAEEQEQSS